MSRNLTNRDDNKNDMPTDKTNNSNIKGKINNHDNEGYTPLINAKMNKATKPNNRLIKADKALDNTNKYFGILIFLIKSPLATTDTKPCTVASEKKFQNIMPVKR